MIKLLQGIEIVKNAKLPYSFIINAKFVPVFDWLKFLFKGWQNLDYLCEQKNHYCTIDVTHTHQNGRAINVFFSKISLSF